MGRKSRIKIEGLLEEVFNSIYSDPFSFFKNVNNLAIVIPEWSKILMIVFDPKNNSLDVSFYEEIKDFFLSYTKRSIRAANKDFYASCFNREAGENWKSFVPPTLIGTNLDTKLRKKCLKKGIV